MNDRDAVEYWTTVELRVLAARAKTAKAAALIVEADARRLLLGPAW